MFRKTAILILGLAAACGVSAAQIQYTATPAQMDAKQNSGFLGTVAVAAPVTVLAKKGDRYQVRVEGWALKEYPSQIFKDAGLRIEYASFDEEGVVKLNAKAGEKTVQGNVWVRVSAQGWVDAKTITGDVNALWKKGKDRLGQACSSCHGAPAADHFTANQWASQLPVRGGRAGHTRAGANALMFKCLQEHAKK